MWRRTRRHDSALGGMVDVRPSGALRVRVFAGYDSISGKGNYLVEHVPPGPNAEAEAEEALVRLLNEVNERRNPRTKATVNQLPDKYLAVANLDSGTLRGYQRNYKNHVKPLLGAKKVAEVDADLLDSFYAELRRCRKHAMARNAAITGPTSRTSATNDARSTSVKGWGRRRSGAFSSD